MKKFILCLAISAISVAHAQFTVSLTSSDLKNGDEAYLYTLNGSKDVLSSKAVKNSSGWMFKVPASYMGMMRVYIPQGNNSINLISENKDVNVGFKMKANKISDIEYKDDSNRIMNEVQDVLRKKEVILPALYQMNEYYTTGSPFKTAMNQEIERLSQNMSYDAASHPFISYYNSNYKRFLVQDATSKANTEDDVVNFISGSSEMLESSSLLKPILISYLNNAPKATVSGSIDKLLSNLNIETARGQTVLSEFIEIFDTYEMEDLKKKYLAEATSLKCTINDRLAGTISTNKNVEMGATFQNYTFTNAFNTTAKSIYDVKADKKVILFWASTCSHCEEEIPKIIEKYAQLKAQNIQVIGLSTDADKEKYENRIKDLPWINDAEIRGWNSSYAEKYNVHATPTYFVLDKNNKIIAKPEHVGDLIKFLNLK
ncbi:TlpA family protein disulfide reductase [Halpernia frigidisoli]|uniref:Thioredoxin-like n=1 Tax=Halpernia frigidisoli TaxID=1125876 RepID=A0A1I3HVU1_9FLAO|nr:TlpA disulfide reductase family protein [Halpernia frigidisoli]SFI39801.1 Thioredoxin-like [Halpernia frigidisoli]